MCLCVTLVLPIVWSCACNAVVVRSFTSNTSTANKVEPSQATGYVADEKAIPHDIAYKSIRTQQEYTR